MRLTEQQMKDLALVNADLSKLANKRGPWQPQDDVRFGQLKMNQRAIENGMTLAELDEERANEVRARNGLETTTKQNGHSREAEVRAWKAVAEKRDMSEGSIIPRIGTYSGLGFFVPTDFFPQVFGAMKAHDALFDPENVTFISSTNGRPLPVPTYDDTEIVASVVSEAGSQTSVDIDATNQAVLGAYSYSTPRFVCSLEAFDDTEGGVNIIDMFKKFSAGRLARGIGADLVVGSGSGKTLGLIPSIEALGVAPVSAAGSSANTGGTESGASSIGTDDFIAALNTLDDAYANSPKCAWLMNKKTLANVSGIKNKMGDLLNFVKYVDGVPTILNIPVKICPSMDNIGVSNVPVVLGDLSYWATRLIVDDISGIKIYREAPGLIENGNVGFRTFVRAHGALLYSGVAAQSPFIYIRNHS
jgi:HK97 family phage major capsid protein